MCIAFPGKVLSIDDDQVALIDIGGTRREVSLAIVDEAVAVGDYVICHAGFAIHRLDEQAAEESLALLREIIDHEIY